MVEFPYNETTGRDTPAVTSRDALVGAIAAWNPPDGGWDISFGDVQIALDSDTAARAFLTVAMTTADPATGQPSVDSREARVGMVKLDDVWVIKTAEPVEPVQRP